jgi:transposase
MPGPSARLHRLEAMPREKMMERVERRYLSGERRTLAQVWLYKGALVPTHTHESEQISSTAQCDSVWARTARRSTSCAAARCW